MKFSWILFLPILVYTLGFAFNALATYFNGGFMPVIIPGGCPGDLDWNHVCVSGSTHLKVLSDIFTNNGGVSSLGDYLLDNAGDLWQPSFYAYIGRVLIYLVRGR